ncbi:hypothetical protein GGI12_003789 [Dipsacomyces acuminosporus]|nr:hypothetical protein GGI12_003789 [Dipsacomyces acuminosporus]
MGNHSKFTLPRWYAEDKFLLQESMRALADVTEDFTFALLFMTPTNRDHRDCNHLHMDFCHLEFPGDKNGELVDPPENIADIVKQTYKDQGVGPRCVIDCTFKSNSSEVADRFEKAGFICERGLVDTVMTLRIDDPPRFKQSDRVSRILDTSKLLGVVGCNQKAFGYGTRGDSTDWLHEKLQRQVQRPDEFSIWALDADGKTASFAVIFTPREKARDLAFIQVVGSDPGCRRQGLAQEVLLHALGQLDKGTRVYLEAFEDGPIALYKKIGFGVAGTTTVCECYMQG